MEFKSKVKEIEMEYKSKIKKAEEESNSKIEKAKEKIYEKIKAKYQSPINNLKQRIRELEYDKIKKMSELSKKYGKEEIGEALKILGKNN